MNEIVLQTIVTLLGSKSLVDSTLEGCSMRTIINKIIGLALFAATGNTQQTPYARYFLDRCQILLCACTCIMLSA